MWTVGRSGFLVPLALVAVGIGSALGQTEGPVVIPLDGEEDRSEPGEAVRIDPVVVPRLATRRRCRS